ncbi:MAG TPA: dienelactone hydrolase family protein [Alphaproteobacteria bacterium]|nr:dienelactone hydrolase family protein [Alphaproteobacteria bacterium]
MEQRYIDLYDEFTHTGMPRRVFMERLTIMAGSAAAATSIASMIGPNYAKAAIVKPDDSRLMTEMLTYPGKTGPINAYHVRPKGNAKLPAIVVIHENRGLNPHIEDVGRRLVLQGYNVLVPDSLSPMGGTPASTDEAVKMIGKLNNADTLANYVAAVDFMKKNPGSDGKVGVIGFCWGGGFANQTAIVSPDVTAAVVYYGLAPKPEDVAKLHAPTIVHLGALDKRIGSTYPAFEKALKGAGKNYTIYTYDGANHAFNNDSDPTRYNASAAKPAWSRTLAHFKKYLKS